jgi:hypothetical protein
MHMPQLRIPPQPSGTVPQFCPGGHTPIVQPHWLGVPPPPHVCGAMHVPQSTVPPQPLSALPQFWPLTHACSRVLGVHPH